MQGLRAFFAFFLFFSLAITPAETAETHVIAAQAEQFMLENGLQVIVIPDHRVPVVTHMIWYKVGSADEERGHSGIAHFLEHLMFKGTLKNPEGKFMQWIDGIGGQQNASTSYDYTFYYQRAAKNFLPQLMEFESDRMTGLVLNDSNVVPEREVVMEERRERTEQQPEAILSETMGAALYQNHPYGTPVIGWMQEIRKLTRQEALAFYGRFYTPNNAILVIAGDVTANEVRKLAREHYGRIQRRAEPPPRLRAQEPVPRAARSVTHADVKVEQAAWAREYLVPPYAGPDSEYAPALEMLEQVLGGNAGRLYQRLAVDLGIASGTSVSYNGRALDSGTFSLSVTPKSVQDFPAIEKEIEAVLQDIAENGVKPGELERARSALLANTVYMEDNQTYLARLFGFGLTTGDSFENIRRWPQKIAVVTAEDIRDAVRGWLTKERSVTGYLVPEQAASAEKKK